MRTPWTYEVHELSEGNSAIVYDCDGVRVGTDHLTEAEASLIAAAPDMYEALKKLVERIDFNGGIGEYQGGPAFVMEKARAALAKVQP